MAWEPPSCIPSFCIVGTACKQSGDRRARPTPASCASHQQPGCCVIHGELHVWLQRGLLNFSPVVSAADNFQDMSPVLGLPRIPHFSIAVMVVTNIPQVPQPYPLPSG
jgi:hypothetical protein